MKTYIFNTLDEKNKTTLLNRPAIDNAKIEALVKPVIEDVKQNGISAVTKYAKQFDGFDNDSLRVGQAAIDNSETLIEEKVKVAIDNAIENIRKFHEAQLPATYSLYTQPGVRCSREFRPIENVGIYIPGGTAVLPSTLLMLAIPAKIAGCKRIVACSPAGANGHNPALLYAAKACGVSELYSVGGAQAIAMMAYGVEGVPKVDKIFGPGSQFVTTAKTLVSSDPLGATIDMPAGPSEVLVIADKNADPAFVAADLLSQAEHGSDSQSILVTTDKTLAEKVTTEMKTQLAQLKRKEYAQASLEHSFILIVDSMQEAIAFSNQYAPEHLILNFDNAKDYLASILNAGSVFVGAYSPESAGDYASGTNHSLPTYGYAKSIGGVTVENFMKSITFQHLTKKGLELLAPTVIALAETEDLHAHANAVKVRIK